MKLLCLLCLLPVIQGQITFNVLASSSPREVIIDRSGSLSNIITKQDESAFKITENLLKNGVFNITGRVPTNVYMKGPTPWNDLYSTYGWEPVRTIIKPLKTRILSIEKENVIIKEKTLINTENVTKKQTLHVDGKVENRITTLWITKDMFAANITCNVEVFGMVNSRFSLNSSWGRNAQATQVVNTGTLSSVDVNLPPNGNITVVLSGSKVTSVIEIEYAAILYGHVVTNNEVKLQGHHFWSYDIGEVMGAVHASDVLKATEVVTLEYYTDYVIAIAD